MSMMVMNGFNPVVDGLFNPPPAGFDAWNIIDKWHGRLTKRQRKNQLRIVHWFYGEPFRETSRAKEAVPELTNKEVLETFVGRDVKHSGMHFTPPEMAHEVAGYLDAVVWQAGSILEPCAGIGHLLVPLDNDTHVVAYDVCETNVGLGARLFPWVEWHWRVPFRDVDVLSGQFDVVLMNPPYGIRRGMGSGVVMAQGRSTKSEYLFLELALRAVKPGGQVAVIAPYNFWEKRPKPLKVWTDERAVLEDQIGPLSGKFQTTNVNVHLFLVRRREISIYIPSEDVGCVQLRLI